jgi:hypothetical protein
LALVPLGQHGIADTSELILDDHPIGFLDVLLIEQVLQLKDPLLPGCPRGCTSTFAQNEGREAVETPMTPGRK